jgi:hypothetical protein
VALIGVVIVGRAGHLEQGELSPEQTKATIRIQLSARVLVAVLSAGE